MEVRQLQPQMDYLYCAECSRHVPCVRLPGGVWEVQCPRCAGECGLCSCLETGTCVSKGDVKAPTHVFIADKGPTK